MVLSRILENIASPVLGVVLPVVCVGCSSTKGTPPQESCSGQERCACYPNGTCDDDLKCLSDLCVSAGSGGDGGASAGGQHGASSSGGTDMGGGPAGGNSGGVGPASGGGSSTGGHVGGGGHASGGGGAGTGGAGGAEGELRIGILGRMGVYGAVAGDPSRSALGEWLEDNSEADVQTITTEPELDEAFLAQFDVLILQPLEDAPGAGNQWSFDTTERSTLEAWVRAGGGVIALSGYSDQPAEAATINSLLSFSNLQYAGLTGPGDTATPGQASDCSYCLGNSIAQGGWTEHPLAEGIVAVGAFFGRSINAPNVARVAYEGSTVYAAAALVDMGRVFLFHDDWVTYVSQWTGAGLALDCREEVPAHVCYDHHPTSVYQVPLFWQNALRWAGQNATFTINDESIAH